MITRTFKLCLNAGSGSAPYINVNQYDEGETWLFELYSETGERYIPSTGAIVGVKSDGHGIVNTGTVDSEGRVVITETQQMTASAGRAIFELSIDGLTHGTANFVVAVERKPTDDAVMSDSDLSLIQEAVDAAATIEDLIEGHDPDEVIADAVDAWLDAHPEATTTVEDGAITEAKLNDSVKTGVFEDMTVGTSLAVMNDEGVTDNLAYKFRQTGGDAVRELDEIVGGTVAWNQMVNAVTADGEISGVTITGITGGRMFSGTATQTVNSNLDASVVSFKKDHVYIISAVSGGSASTYYFGTTGSGSFSSNKFDTYVFKPTTSSNEHIRLTILNGATVTNLKAIPQVFDLTAMFGSTVADAIYAMEQSSAGSGVAYFRSLFPNAYYAYNAGELVSVEGLSAHETVEKNLLNPSPWSAYLQNDGTYRLSANAAIGIHVPIPSALIGKEVTFSAYINSQGDAPSNERVGARINGTVINGNFIASGTEGYSTITVTPVTADDYLTFGYASGAAKYFTFSEPQLEINSERTAYKPYQKHTYPLDSSLTLRGVPKWNNGLYYDGDIYGHDGSVSRRYGIVDLGTLTWTYDSTYSRFNTLLNDSITASDPRITPMVCAKYTVISDGRTIGNVPDKSIYHGTNKDLSIHDSAYSDAATFKSAMSGVYLVYELATPTTEQADPYQQYQICDGKGTEEYVSETVTPVGHSTFYPVDIVAKVNGLPSDFSTLIAPTEEGFKATRNYTVNDLLIVNNVLYKVTATIANGATITPNTNVSQTTLSALIKALSA